nr:MAG TPA: tail protein [Caudoviricetes sp.]
MQFDISPQSPEYRLIAEEERIEYDGTYYNIKSINERRTIATVNAEIDLDELKSKIFSTFKYDTISFVQAMSTALDGTGWSVVGAGLVTAKRSFDLTDVTPLDIVNNCTNKTMYNVSFDVDNICKILNVSVPATLANNVFFSDELNLKELTFKGSSSGFATRLYAYGKDGLSFAKINNGKEYIDNNSYSNKVIATVWRDERYTKAESLLVDAQEKLKELAVPERSYVCEIIDLARLNKIEYSEFYIRLNSVITLIDRRRNKRLEHTVVEIKEYPNEPLNNTVTLSTSPEKISRKLIDNTTRINQISTTVDKQPSAWQKAIETATALITGASGGYVVLNPSEKPSELLIMNTPDINTATKIWRFNVNGFGFSSNGYKGPFPLAMTMDGAIVADRITIGVLQGIKIIATIGSIAGWKMENGVLVSDDGTMKLDSVNNTITVNNRDGNKLMTVSKDGIKFWRGDTEIGQIGIRGGDTGQYGLTFDLIDGDAMTWSVYDSTEKVYVNKLRYTESDGLNVSNNFTCNQFFGHNVTDIDLGNGLHAWGYNE